MRQPPNRNPAGQGGASEAVDTNNQEKLTPIPTLSLCQEAVDGNCRVNDIADTLRSLLDDLAEHRRATAALRRTLEKIVDDLHHQLEHGLGADGMAGAAV